MPARWVASTILALCLNVSIRSFLASANKKPIREILITGYADEQMSAKVEELKVAEYMYKPFDLRDFLACVKKNLEA